MGQTLDEIERPGSAKAAKCVYYANCSPHEAHQIPRIILVSDDEGPPSSSQPSSSQPTGTKPRGLGTTGRHTRAVNTIIEDFDYQGGTSLSGSDEESEEDNLEYPGDTGKTLVRVFLKQFYNIPTHS